MFPSRKEILEKYLGLGNTGPKILNPSEQFEIFKNIVSHLISIVPALKDANVKRANNHLSFEAASIYDRQTHENFYSKDQIKNLANAQNIPYHEATNKIAKYYFNLEMKDLFGYEFPSTSIQESSEALYNINLMTTPTSLPMALELNNNLWEQSGILQYSKNDSTFSAGELFYKDKNSNNYFSINLCYFVSDKFNYPLLEVIPGYKYDKAILLNRDKIVNDTSSNDKPIVIFHDKLIALNFCQNCSNYPFIPSALSLHFTINNFDLTHLKYRNIILFPLADIKSYRSIIYLAENIKNLPAKSVRIANYPILPFSRNGDNTGLDNEEFSIQHIVKEAKIFSEIDPQKFLEDTNKILTVEKYSNWLTKVGLNSTTNLSSNNFSFSILDEGLINIDSFIDLHDFFKPGTISFCYGESTVGKSAWALSIALAFASGFDIFNIISKRKEKVLYLDYESDENMFKFTSLQLINAYNLDKSSLDLHLKFCSRKMGNNVNPIFPLDKEHVYIDELKDIIKKFGAKLIIIDPLSEAASQAYSHSTHANLFMSFLRDLNSELGTSFLIIHHSNSSGKMRGAEELFSSADNVIRLSKFTNNINSHKKLLSLTMTIEKSKIFPQYIDKSMNFSLEYPDNLSKSTRWMELIDLSSDNINSYQNNLEKLDEKQHNLISLLKINPKGITALKLAKMVTPKVSSRTILNWIKEINKIYPGLINNIGSGRNSKWILNFDYKGSQP